MDAVALNMARDYALTGQGAGIVVRFGRVVLDRKESTRHARATGIHFTDSRHEYPQAARSSCT